MRQLNPKFTFFMVIGICVLCLFGFTHIQKINAENKEIAYQEKLKQDKLLEESYIKIIEPTLEPTITPYQIYAPLPVRIDNSMKLNQYFNWYADNVSGLKDINVSSTIYGYKELESFTYYDFNWGKEFKEYAPEGMTYFFAYIYTQLDDKGTTVYLPQQSQYGLSINDLMYYPIQFEYEKNQIREMDEQYNKNHVERIKPYAYEYIYKGDEITKVKKPVIPPLYYLRAGKSNAEDGYIVFLIPKEYNKRMLRIHANFFSFGSASWKII